VSRRGTPYSDLPEEEKEKSRQASREWRLARKREAAEEVAFVRGYRTGLEPQSRELLSGALCARRGMPPEMFWHPSDRKKTTTRLELLFEQRSVARTCHACPVRQACLDDARANRSEGIWGGVLRGDRGQEHDLIALHVLPHLERSAA
jgi:hypothetical protein